MSTTSSFGNWLVRLQVARVSSTVATLLGTKKNIFVKTAPLTRTNTLEPRRSEISEIWTVCECTRFVKYAQNTKRLRAYGLLLRAPFCICRHTESYGLFISYTLAHIFANNVYCTVTLPIRGIYGLLLCSFMCKGPVDNIDNAPADRWSAGTGCTTARGHWNAQSVSVDL